MIRLSQRIIIDEISAVMSGVDTDDVNKLIEMIEGSSRIFVVGVGRVKLSLQSIAKRWNHLGIPCSVVGDINEPAITNKDLLLVGSGSGESIFPLEIAKKAKLFGAKVAHIGSNSESSISQLSDVVIDLKTQPKTKKEGGIKSIQPMTSLFEQSLLILGDSISLTLIQKNQIELDSLWEYHANLE